ncbi:hypothetical protein H2201_005285 [Coniosporium apollinis]|uniref:BZIP domain-containing protein n=2 Tax=Coniosporium TaxID=2810619 RepID=A0ABQ9NWY3_9PEZI|nr:hypothetical protein H2199_004181 [Cladosporium sp. JES 115]KAJ9664293.1 hypothetical protein H2201_005285 [Coniosporium apollinis]
MSTNNQAATTTPANTGAPALPDHVRAAVSRLLADASFMATLSRPFNKDLTAAEHARTAAERLEGENAQLKADIKRLKKEKADLEVKKAKLEAMKSEKDKQIDDLETDNADLKTQLKG